MDAYASRVDSKPTFIGMYIKNVHFSSTSKNINFGHFAMALGDSLAGGKSDIFIFSKVNLGPSQKNSGLNLWVF